MLLVKDEEIHLLATHQLQNLKVTSGGRQLLKERHKNVIVKTMSDSKGGTLYTFGWWRRWDFETLPLYQTMFNCTLQPYSSNSHQKSLPYSRLAIFQKLCMYLHTTDQFSGK